MNSNSLLYTIILVINSYDTAVCQLMLSNLIQNFTKCGESTLHSTNDFRIIDGTLSQISNFPWHAGLYYRQQNNSEVSWEQKCGGSLITDQFVLTAAHCVYNTNEGDLRVALGKLYRSWDRHEYSEQKRNVSIIVYPIDDYQEVTYYFDIALLLLDEKLTLGQYVMPVCIGFMGISNDILNKTLYVAGWGQTKNVQSGSPSETLLYTDMSFLPRSRCQRVVPTGYVIFDKFCTIKNNDTGMSFVQRGDSGGGLTVVYNGKHYIFGIVSVKLGRSDDSQMTLFTNITWPNHVLWIERKMGKYLNGFKWTAKELTPDIITVPSRCVLPDSSPERRFCSVENGCDESCDFDSEVCVLSPGSSVERVKVLCAPGYITLNRSSSDIVVCQGNSWYPPIPDCHKLCPALKSEMLVMTCRYGTDEADCSKPALPNTTISFKCAPPIFTEYVRLRKEGVYDKGLTCTPNGEWSDNLPICKQICGVFNKDKMLTSTVDGGQEELPSFLPWHAGLYYYKDMNGRIIWEQKCGGSVITNRVILTAARCVQRVKHTNYLRVAVGKYYRSWNVNESTEQRLNVSTFTYPSDFSSGTTSYDIALVVLSETITFNDHVMPVCRDAYLFAYSVWDSNLYVAGWGRANAGKTRDVLLYNTVTTTGKDECGTAISTGSTYQTICVVKSNSSDSIVQKGNYGGGLTAVNDKGLHYIFGIFSRNEDRISLFTNTNSRTHIDWVESELRRLKKDYD